MKLIDTLLQFHSIFLDTSPFIYFVEGHPRYEQMTKEMMKAIDAGDLDAYASILTLTEVLPKPVKQGDDAIYLLLKNCLLNNSRLHTKDISAPIAEKAGLLRGKYSSLRTVDAIQLATAITEGVKCFVTNDKQLRKVEEISIVILDDYL